MNPGGFHSTLQVDSLPAEPQGKSKNTGVGSLSLLQRIFLTQELNCGLLHCRQIFLPTVLPGSPEIYRHINQCSVVKSLVVNLYIYGWLTFGQGTKTIHEEKKVSSANGSGVTEVELLPAITCKKYLKMGQRPKCKSCGCCSVTQSCLTLCDPMDCSTPGLPVTVRAKTI